MKNNKQITNNKNTPKSSVYRRIRDPLCQDASINAPSMLPVTSNGSGTTNGVVALNPFGIEVPALTVSAGALSATNTFWDTAHLPWFFSTARNFEKYRVLNATLIFVGNIGSVSTGALTVVSTTDITDYVKKIVTPATSTGGKTIDLATAATREQRFPLDIDSRWKLCSASTTYVTNGAVQTLYTLNSMNDLTFSVIDYVVVGAPATTNVGSFYVEYDVEFRDPTSFVMNA